MRSFVQGDWKLVSGKDAKPQLFDLKNDLKEDRDLAAERPEVVNKLTGLHNAWKAEVQAETQGVLGKSSPSDKKTEPESKVEHATEE